MVTDVKRLGVTLAGSLLLALVAGCNSCRDRQPANPWPFSTPDSVSEDIAPPDDAAPTEDTSTPSWTNGFTLKNGESVPVDILWVIDNSGSMCEEQEALRRNFRVFVDVLEQIGVDFNVGVTTTHFVEEEKEETLGTDYENIARPGRLQATPHPPPSNAIGSCTLDGPDESGELDFSPIRAQIDDAIACTKNPEQFEELRNWSREEIRCATLDRPPPPNGSDRREDCEQIGKEDSFSTADLFPCAHRFDETCDREQLDRVYRDLPKVLDASDYGGAGNLDIEKLRKDFACMSFVGTRGSGFEEGLQAAARAVSPVLTGGPKENPYEGATVRDRLEQRSVEVVDGANQPNHGLIRAGAKTAVLFLTDENDCSHPSDATRELADLDVDRRRRCLNSTCYFETKKPADENLLIPAKTLYRRFTQNLEASEREGDLGERQLIFGSIHGIPDEYTGEIRQTCTRSQREQLREDLKVCTTDRGSAFSGDRYADFLSRADSNGQTVIPSDPTTGYMCKSDMSQPVRELAKKVRRESRTTCLENPPIRCDTSKGAAVDCPPFEYSVRPMKTCAPWADGEGSPDGFCRSAVRVQMTPTAGRTFAELEGDAAQTAQQLCLPETLGGPPDGACLIRRDFYEWGPCPENPESATELRWNTELVPEPGETFDAFKVDVRVYR